LHIFEPVPPDNGGDEGAAEPGGAGMLSGAEVVFMDYEMIAGKR